MRPSTIVATCSAARTCRRRSGRRRCRPRARRAPRRPCRSARRRVDDLPAGLDQEPGDRVGHQTVCPSSCQTGPCVPTCWVSLSARSTVTVPRMSSRRSARGSGAPSPARRRSPRRARSGSGARRGRRRGAGSSGCRAPPRARRSRSRAASARTRRSLQSDGQPRARVSQDVGERVSRARAGARRRPAWSSQRVSVPPIRRRRAAPAGA